MDFARLWFGTNNKAFVGRLPSLQDLSAHHASSDHSVPEGGPGTGEAFREGMEGEERERKSSSFSELMC